MRLVQFALPDDDREAILDVLDGEEIDYVLLSGADATHVQFPLPTQAVEPVFDALEDAGLDGDYVVVTSAESARTEHFDELEERYVAGAEADESIEPEEIRTTAHDMTPNAATYYAMTVLSAVVAVSGLLLDSPALVVGSMVIAPQVGSALTASVGVVLDDREMVRAGLRAQVVGLLVAVFAAAAVGWALRSASFVPGSLDVTTVHQIGQRISPGVLSVVVGLAAGAAGALGLATALPVSLVGVAVAAALLPAAAAVGIGIAWGLPIVAAGAALLLVTNLAAINIAAPGTLWALGYRPLDWGEVPYRRYARAAAVVVLILVVFGASVALTTGQMSFERNANRAVATTLDDPQYADLTLVDVRATLPLVAGDAGVTVTVARPADHPYPSLVGDIRGALAARSGRSVPVEVEYVDRNRAPP